MSWEEQGHGTLTRMSCAHILHPLIFPSPTHCLNLDRYNICATIIIALSQPNTYTYGHMGVVTSSRWQLRDHVVSEGAHPSRHQHGSGTLFHCSTTFPTRTEPTVTMLRFLVSSEYHFRTTQTIEHLWGLHNRLLWAATPNIQPSSS